jgi:hypothetical protein
VLIAPYDTWQTTVKYDLSVAQRKQRFSVREQGSENDGQDAFLSNSVKLANYTYNVVYIFLDDGSCHTARKFVCKRIVILANEHHNSRTCGRTKGCS